MQSREEEVKALVENAKTNSALCGTLSGLVFTAAVVFIGLSNQSLFSGVVVSMLIFTTFLHVMGMTVYSSIAEKCTIENYKKHYNVYGFADNLAALGLVFMLLSLCLLAFYVNLIIGVIITALIITITIITLSKIPA